MSQLDHVAWVLPMMLGANTYRKGDLSGVDSPRSLIARVSCVFDLRWRRVQTMSPQSPRVTLLLMLRSLSRAIIALMTHWRLLWEEATSYYLCVLAGHCWQL